MADPISINTQTVAIIVKRIPKTPYFSPYCCKFAFFPFCLRLVGKVAYTNIFSLNVDVDILTTAIMIVFLLV